jgi:hypothetical protein
MIIKLELEPIQNNKKEYKEEEEKKEELQARNKIIFLHLIYLIEILYVFIIIIIKISIINNYCYNRSRTSNCFFTSICLDDFNLFIFKLVLLGEAIDPGALYPSEIAILIDSGYGLISIK